MAVNSYLISEKLDNCIVRKLSSPLTECKIKYVTIYNPLLEIKENTAYIVVDTSHFPTVDTGERCLMIVLGCLAEKIVEETKHDCLCLKADYGLGKLYENLQGILEYYNEWEEKMAGILLKDGSLNEICSISVPYFRNPLTVQTGNFEIIGVGESEDIKYPYQFREGDSDYLSDEWIRSALDKAEKVFKTSGPFEFHYIKEHSSLLYNIFHNRRYQGQICVDGNNDKIVKGDYIRISILAKYVEQFLKKDEASSFMMKNRFRSQLAEFISANKRNRAALKVSIEKHGWQEEDHFICYIAKMTQSNLTDRSLEYFCKKWEQRLPECLSFAVNDLIYIIVDLGKREEADEKHKQAVLAMCQEYDLTIGVSRAFKGFFFCRDYFIQAVAAIKIGRKYIKESAVFDFDKFSLRYLIRYGVDSLPLHTIIPDGLRALINYDKDNDSDYYKTLAVYIYNNQNVTETINQLFMHRSTFKYRLQKIKEIMRSDLDDKDEQLYMEMLFFESEEKIFNAI